MLLLMQITYRLTAAAHTLPCLVDELTAQTSNRTLTHQTI